MLNSEEERWIKEIYQKYAGKMYGFLQGLSKGNRRVSEEICQEVWVSLARRSRDLIGSPDEQVLAWLRLMARVKYRRYIENQEKHRDIALEELSEDEACAEDSMEELILLEVLCKETFDELTDMEKELVWCRTYGLSYKKRHPDEKRTENALAIRCSRAFRKWRREIREQQLKYS